MYEKFFQKVFFETFIFRQEGEIVLICLLFSQINQFRDVQNSIRFRREYLFQENEIDTDLFEKFFRSHLHFVRKR